MKKSPSANKVQSSLDLPPLITLRDMLVFPSLPHPFVVGRKASIAALNAALEERSRIFLLLQKDPEVKNPGKADLFETGVVAKIVGTESVAKGHLKVLMRGLFKAKVEHFVADGSFKRVSYIEIPENTGNEDEIEVLSYKLSRRFEDSLKRGRKNGVVFPETPINLADPVSLSYRVANHLRVTTDVKQMVLETTSLSKRLELLIRLLKTEKEQEELDQRLNREVEKKIEKAQKEYFLNEKMKLIRKELGREDVAGELDKLEEKIKKAGLPAHAEKRALDELSRLQVMPPISAEATVARSYVDWLLALPWSKLSRGKKDINDARRILNEDHYGLDKVKERILEFLSVRHLAKEARSEILCFVGPPGVGKTSVAKSIARSMGRKFVRLSLGGVHDEAEIKGHRRTYIGAFPGQIVQLLKRAETRNPVFLLDEVDKLGADYRGDPSSALLEVLDHEVNNAFVDHYIDLPFDLSKVFFITTANVTDTIPPALLDRMEVIRFSGYAQTEKLAIAEGFLIPKQLKRNGLRKKDVTFTQEGLKFLIDGYTREAGVRNLEREISALCRKIAYRVVHSKRRDHETLTPERTEELLSVPRYKDLKTLKEDEVGTALGLAWTQFGGEILLVEVGLMKGKGNLIMTGKLGDVMQESAKTIFSFLKGLCGQLGLRVEDFKESDVHVHVPEGAIPKDGPSAGVSLGIAMVSAFTGIPVRHDVAMTGETTLRGRVLPVGGIKEKVLAAKRHEVFDLILPEGNRHDLAKLPEEFRRGMNFHYAKTFEEVMAVALAENPLKVKSSILLRHGKETRPEKTSR